MKPVKFAFAAPIVAIGVSLLVALGAQATDYTWTGGGEDGTLRWIQGPKSGLMLKVR